MKHEEIKEKIKQIEAAIEINEQLDLSTEDLYRMKHEYEDQLLVEEEPVGDKEEDNEMSPFLCSADRHISDCLKACKEKANSSDPDALDTCDGCEHHCEFVRDYKGRFIIKHPFLEVWVLYK